MPYADVEKQRAAIRRYHKDPANRETVERAKKAWLARNPDKRAAHVAVGNAIRDGRLKKQPCEVCGEPKVHAHHDDYSKPLDVRWLCPLHHGATRTKASKPKGSENR